MAKINTEGVRVIDVFYVREQDGSKVCLDERAAELRKALVEYVEGPELEREER